MVAAAQIISPRCAGCEQDVLAFAGLHHDFGVFAVEHVWIIDFCSGEKRRRRELMRLLAVIFQMQPVMDAALECQMKLRTDRTTSGTTARMTAGKTIINTG